MCLKCVNISGFFLESCLGAFEWVADQIICWLNTFFGAVT